VRVAARNAEGHATFGLTKFADLSPSEFSSMYLKYKPSEEPRTPVEVRNASSWSATDPIDWRTKGAVTAVKDQGQCGSCWAFSTTEEIESMWFLDGNPLTELSPQQIVSCDHVDQGCDGGDPPTAYAYVEKAGGLETGADYPYTSGKSGENGQCKADKADNVAHISGFKYATPGCTDSCNKQNEATLLNSLGKSPVSICVDAESWQDYSSGILENCPHAYGDLDHCVQLVGYTPSATKPFWIVRNSWNTDWGIAGYIYLGYGTNQCGVADEATIATI